MISPLTASSPFSKKNSTDEPCMYLPRGGRLLTYTDSMGPLKNSPTLGLLVRLVWFFGLVEVDCFMLSSRHLLADRFAPFRQHYFEVECRRQPQYDLSWRQHSYLDRQ